jgi:uncharacterized protein YjeT (DUF2065 family)
MLKITIGLVFVATGLFYFLAASKIIHPFKNSPERLLAIVKHKVWYQVGGLIVTVYGIYKIIQT